MLGRISSYISIILGCNSAPAADLTGRLNGGKIRRDQQINGLHKNDCIIVNSVLLTFPKLDRPTFTYC